MDIEKLKELGIDYNEGLARFANKPKLYEKYLGKFLADESFQALTDNLALGEYQEAFKAAHSLKGVSGNLSMNIFYHYICKLVEELRGEQNKEEIERLYQPVKEEYLKLVAGLKALI